VPDEPQRAVRLVFSYAGDEVSLLDRTELETVTAPTEPAPAAREVGHWVEVRDEGGETLYRRTLHDPIPADVEVFSDEGPESISRQPVERPTGAFTVLVPLPERADHVAVVGTEPAGAARGASPREFIRVDVGSERRP
jgi:hypothetical protein